MILAHDRIPAQLFENVPDLGRGPGLDPQLCSGGRWMREFDGMRPKKQTAAFEVFPEQAIVLAGAVGRVADQWMGNVSEVTADLMPAPGPGLDPRQRVPGSRVAF